MKGTLGVGPSLSDEVPWRGTRWGQRSFTGNLGIYVQIVSGHGHLSIGAV